MTLNNQQYKETVLEQMRFRGKLFKILCFLFALIPPVIFFIATVSETNSFGKELLGNERYTARMNDSYLYAVVMFAFFLVFAIPGIFVIDKFFKRYFSVVNTLSNQDLEKFKNVNENLSFIEKYMPSYIIKENVVIFFRLFNQFNLNFMDMESLNVKTVYGKNAGYTVKIKVYLEIYNFKLSTNSKQIQNLVYEALTQNPTIVVNQNWN